MFLPLKLMFLSSLVGVSAASRQDQVEVESTQKDQVDPESTQKDQIEAESTQKDQIEAESNQKQVNMTESDWNMTDVVVEDESTPSVVEEVTALDTQKKNETQQQKVIDETPQYSTTFFTSVAQIDTNIIFELTVPANMAYEYAGADPCLAITPIEEDLIVQFTQSFFSDYIRQNSESKPPKQVYISTQLSINSFESVRTIQHRRKKLVGEEDINQRELCLCVLEGYMIFENIPEYAANENSKNVTIPDNWSPPNDQVIQEMLYSSLDTQEEVDAFVEGIFMLDSLADGKAGETENRILSFVTYMNIQRPEDEAVIKTKGTTASAFFDIWNDPKSFSGFLTGVAAIVCLVGVGFFIRWIYQKCVKKDFEWRSDGKREDYNDYESKPSPQVDRIPLPSNDSFQQKLDFKKAMWGEFHASDKDQDSNLKEEDKHERHSLPLAATASSDEDYTLHLESQSFGTRTYMTYKRQSGENDSTIAPPSEMGGGYTDDEMSILPIERINPSAVLNIELFPNGKSKNDTETPRSARHKFEVVWGDSPAQSQLSSSDNESEFFDHDCSSKELNHSRKSINTPGSKSDRALPIAKLSSPPKIQSIGQTTHFEENILHPSPKRLKAALNSAMIQPSPIVQGRTERERDSSESLNSSVESPIAKLNTTDSFEIMNL